MGESGVKWEEIVYFYNPIEKLKMTDFIGDFTCKLDDKGRVLLPSAFIRQMAGSMQDRFVIKKDIFDSCLVLFPMIEWERQNQVLRKNTNPYNREHNRFLRGFFKGIAEVVLDASNRLLIPKRLLDEIGANREIVMTGQLGKIEIWTKDAYDKIEGYDENFANLAEKIMGNLNNDTGE